MKLPETYIVIVSYETIDMCILSRDAKSQKLFVDSLNIDLKIFIARIFYQEFCKNDFQQVYSSLFIIGPFSRAFNLARYFYTQISSKLSDCGFGTTFV